MRDADPQGGTLAPIVSINFCDLLGGDCNAGDLDYTAYSGLTATFGPEHSDVMEGRWPLEVNQYGTGFDAYVLDGSGAAAIGPLEFYISDDDDEEVDATHDHPASGPISHGPEAAGGAAPAPSPGAGAVQKASHPLMKYRKGTKKSTERQHAGVSLASAAARGTDAEMARGSGLATSGGAVPSEPSIHNVAGETTGPTPGVIASDKERYEGDEPV